MTNLTMTIKRTKQTEDDNETDVMDLDVKKATATLDGKTAKDYIKHN